MVMYARGTQGDYVALQLVQNRMVLNINLGECVGAGGREGCMGHGRV